ncbi:MAG: TetR/AcrR family transcriptional regulator [Phycisphaerales bacterium]
MAKDTRERLIRVAHDLFYEHGFHAIGLERIIDEVGVTKTTFYNHFESKDAIIVEALRWHDRWWKDEFSRLLRKHGGDSPRARLCAIFDAIAEAMREPGYKGCIFINVAVQFPACADPAHIEAAAHKRSMQGVIEELAAFAGAAKPRALAEELSLVMEGAYVSEQVLDDPRCADIGRRLAEMIIERHLPSR